MYQSKKLWAFSLVFFATCVVNMSVSHATALHEIINNPEALPTAMGLKSWLLKNSVDINAVHPEHGTAFHMVTRLGREDLMLSLFDKKADIDALDTKGSTALHIAINQFGDKKPHIVLLLINMRADLAIECDGLTPRALASSLNLQRIVEMIDAGPQTAQKSEVVDEENVHFDENEDMSWAFDGEEKEQKEQEEASSAKALTLWLGDGDAPIDDTEIDKALKMRLDCDVDSSDSDDEGSESNRSQVIDSENSEDSLIVENFEPWKKQGFQRITDKWAVRKMELDAKLRKPYSYYL